MLRINKENLIQKPQKRKKIPPFVTTWMNVEDIMLSEISQTEKEKYCIISPIRGILKKGKSNSEKQRVELAAKGWGVGETGRC